MSIGLKIMLVILATTLILSGAVLGFSKITFSKSFADLEQKNADSNVARIVSAYDNMLNNLSVLNHDWAFWDDTFNFVLDHNQAFIDSNLTDTSFANAKLNYILIIDKAGEIVYGKSFDLEQEQEVPIPPDLQKHFTSSVVLNHPDINSNTSGIVLLPEYPVMFSAQPITTSKETGIIAGTIIMARNLDSHVIENLKETTHLDIAFNNIPTSESASDLQTAYSQLTHNPVFVKPLNEQSIAGYALINDIYGKAALIVSTEMPRDIYIQGQSTMNYYLLFLLLFSLLFITAIMLLINLLVTRRLKSLSKTVNVIQKTKNLSDRVKVSGKDELSDLGLNINDMLSTIQISQDLLQQKRREEEVLRSTIESVADGLTIFDINGTIRQVNDSTIKMQGYSSKEEVIGRSFRDLINEDDHVRFMEVLQKTLQTGYSNTLEFTFKKREGGTFPVEMSTAILRGTSDQAIGIVAGTRDISERKIMQQALQEKEQQYRLLVENQTDLLVEFNTKGELLFVNPAYCKIVGKTKEQLLRSTVLSQVSEDDQDKFLKALEELKQPSHTAYLEHRLKANTGCRWLAWSFNAVLDDHQNITSVTCSGRDITESKIAKEDLEKANVQLKELDKMKDNLLSTVSHELRTPLTSIKSFTEILLTYDEDKETQNKFLNIISDESDRLTRLINDFLDLSKIQAGKMQWKTVDLSIIDVINSAILVARPLIQKALLELVLEVEPGLPHIMCDRDKLLQVFTNLMGNAVKFTHEGGKITLKAWSVPGDSPEAPQWLNVSISDTGIGIAAENHHKIFDNFGQVGDALKDRPKGTGLGLPICKKIVENFGGKIWVESVLGQGTTFLFSLPALKESLVPVESPSKLQVNTPSAAPIGISEGKSKTILVVDDEANIRCFINHELTKRGYQVIEAGGGRDALDMARKYRPDLITLDISMPDFNGLDVTAVIKNDPDTRYIPILIISVMEEQQRAFQLGANDYLNKPISMDLLAQRVNLLLGNSQKNILVVDDDQALTQSLEYELQKRGFNIKTANSGKQGLSYLEQNHTDLILLDLKMPGMDGFQFMEAAKNKPDIAGIPIVVLTGIDIDGGKSAALYSGATDFFSKNGNFKELFAAIERILKERVEPKETGAVALSKQNIVIGS